MRCLLIALFASFIILIFNRIQAEEAETPQVAEEPAKQPALADMIRDGSSAFTGFGPMAVVGDSFETKLPAPYAWQEADGRRTFKLPSYTVELWQTAADWAAVRKLMPAAGEKDQATARKLFWNGVSAWRADFTLAKPPPGGGMRQRFLVAPAGKGFLVLAFKGDPAKFAEERPLMEQIALGFQFTVNGLIGEYFQGVEINPAQLQRIQVDPTINFLWDGGGPDNGVGPDTFAARWTGRLRAPATTTYAFTTNTDDGIRLWIGDKPVIDNWTDHAPMEDKGVADLEEGKEYPIRLEWYENMGGAVVQLFWETSEISREIIPASAFLSRPEPGFREVPKPPQQQSTTASPPGMPPLLRAQLPGSCRMTQKKGIEWSGKPPKQSMTIGSGASAIQATFQRDRASFEEIRSLLPDAPGDEIEIGPILLKEMPAWRADCRLASGRFMRVYLFPLKQGAAASLRLEAATSDWSGSQKDTIFEILDSLAFSQEAEEFDDNGATKEADPLF